MKKSFSLLLAALLGGFVSQLIPAGMQLHAQGGADSDSVRIVAVDPGKLFVGVQTDIADEMRQGFSVETSYIANGTSYIVMTK